MTTLLSLALPNQSIDNRKLNPPVGAILYPPGTYYQSKDEVRLLQEFNHIQRGSLDPSRVHNVMAKKHSYCTVRQTSKQHDAGSCSAFQSHHREELSAQRAQVRPHSRIQLELSVPRMLRMNEESLDTRAMIH